MVLRKQSGSGLSFLRQVSAKLPRRGVLVAGFSLAWGAIFLGGAVPTWKSAHQNEVTIEAMNDRLATLHEWSVAGIWLGEGVRRWEPVQRETYERLFPLEKAREEFFLDLVRVANASGIDPIRILEAQNTYRPGTDVWEEGYAWDEDLEEQESEIDQLTSEFAPDLSGLPDDRLTAHRALLSFSAEYDEFAVFLAGLKSIPRALSVHRLTASPLDEGIDVRMELDFYVQGAD